MVPRNIHPSRRASPKRRWLMSTQMRPARQARKPDAATQTASRKYPFISR